MPTAFPARRRRLTWLRLRRHRWFALSLRGLMILVLILGGGIGWTAKRASEQRRAVRTLEQAGAIIIYDYEYSDGKRTAAKPREPAWLTRLLGVDALHDVAAVTIR